MTRSLSGDRTTTDVFRGAKGGQVFSPSLSADGRTLAYEWQHENRNNVYVDPVPPTGVHHPVTTDSGSNPMWSPDGRQLYFVRRMGREAVFYWVEIRQTGSTFEIGNSRRMFSVDDLYIAGSGPGNYVDFSPHRKQFVTLRVPPLSEAEMEPRRVNVVLNWFAELTRRVPAR